MTYSIIDTRSISGETISTHKTDGAAQTAWDKLTQTREFIDGRWQKKERPSALTLRIRNDATGKWLRDELQEEPNTDARRLQKLIDDGGYNQRSAAKELEISERMMRYYCSGAKPVPRVVMLAMEHLVTCPSRASQHRLGRR